MTGELSNCPKCRMIKCICPRIIGGISPTSPTQEKECRCYCHEVKKQRPELEHAAQRYCAYYVPLPYPNEDTVKPFSSSWEKSFDENYEPLGNDEYDTRWKFGAPSPLSLKRFISGVVKQARTQGAKAAVEYIYENVKSGNMTGRDFHHYISVLEQAKKV